MTFRILTLIFIFTSCVGDKNLIDQNENLKSLGQLLFFDTRLSVNNTKSCSSCHNPLQAYTDGYRASITSLGENLMRNAPSLLNISKYKYYNWADSSVNTLFEQHARPLYSNKPVELGLHLDSAKIFFKISKDKKYSQLLTKLKITRINDYWVRTALAKYVNSLVSVNSAFDQYNKGVKHALNKQQLEGKTLFYSTKFGCSSCHSFSNLTKNDRSTNSNIYFYRPLNPKDSGLYNVTKNIDDIYKFRIPGLRNVALTAPYFHDGSAPDLITVLDTYQKNRSLYGLNDSIPWTKDEKFAVIHFLHSLTDSSIFANPLFKNPFNDQPN